MAINLQNFSGQFGKLTNQTTNFFNQIKQKADDFLSDFQPPQVKIPTFDEIRQKANYFTKQIDTFTSNVRTQAPSFIEKGLQTFESKIPQPKKLPTPFGFEVPSLISFPLNVLRGTPRTALGFVGADPQTMRETRETQDILQSKLGVKDDIF